MPITREMRNLQELPMADQSREREAGATFPLDMTPEEYAARFAHDWMCFSFDDYRYPDARMERWIHRLGDILFQREGAPSIEELRLRYLTAEEREAIESREKEEF
jgi:hypothetical protein